VLLRARMGNSAEDLSNPSWGYVAAPKDTWRDKQMEPLFLSSGSCKSPNKYSPSRGQSPLPDLLCQTHVEVV